MSNSYLSYFNYLTDRLDKGTSQNIVPSTVAELCKKHLLISDTCKVLDIGCFNGSMLNRALMTLSNELRASIKCVGFDIDNIALTIGSRQHPHINFVCGAIEYPLPFQSTFNITILSNILHEIFSNKKRQLVSDTDAKNYVVQSVKYACQTLSKFGTLVILEGVLPPEPDKKIVVEFQNEATFNDFRSLISDFVFPITYLPLDKQIIELSARHLAIFLAKARYLHEEYCSLEATQVYQFFTENDFCEALNSAGMIIEESKVIPQPIESWNSKLKILTEGYNYPPKNIMIVARKKQA